MSIPIHRLKKAEIVFLAKNRCKAHSHRYIEHYECYLREKPEEDPERIGFFDIEASNLKADYGLMLCYCIKDGLSDKIYEDAVTPRDMASGNEDKRIVANCIKDLQQFDRICGYFSSGFDFPFLRARALINGLDFPSWGTLKHKDLYFAIRGKFALSSKRLENACRQLLGESSKTKIESKNWRQALRGDKEAIEYVLDHCRHDVRDLERLYIKVNEFTKTNNTSI